jgi:hypothetical protein
LGIETKKGKDGFKMEVWEKSTQALLEIQGTEDAEALENELNKQFRWQWSECFREDERDRKQILNKGFKNETLQKILIKRIIEIKLSCSATGGRKEATIGEQQKRV